MVFLPGNHTLDTNITVANLTRLTMRGESSSGNRATIVCSGSVGLSFTSMVDFKMNFLGFTSCRRKYAIMLPNSSIPAAMVHVALHLQSTQNAELVNCSFHDNNGTALVVDNTSITLSGNTEFAHNHVLCTAGGGIIAVDSNVTFTGNTTFLNNSATYGQCPLVDSFLGGGAIFTWNTVISFNGTNNFINNSAVWGSGGAISASHNTVLSFSGINNFINNSAVWGSGGAISTSKSTVLSFSGINNFINNSAVWGSGGAISTSKSTVLSFSGIKNFINNSAVWGGAISTDNTVLSFNGTNNFIHNSADTVDGGAIYATDNTVLSFSGASNFFQNSADGSGGAIFTIGSNVSFSGANNFIKNSADGSGGAIYTIGSNVSFSGANNFIKNSADSSGGAIWSSNVTLTFNGTINFTNNVCTRRLDVDGPTVGGGGVFVGLKSTFSILPSTTVYWENNHAWLGGAIYVQDASPYSYCDSVATLVPKQECFFQLPGQNLSNGFDVQLVFKSNSATTAGSVLYGGAVDNCKLTHGLDSYGSGEVFDMIVHINDTDYNTSSNISSYPLRICLCKNNIPDCSVSLYEVLGLVYPGDTFQVSVVAVGQRDGTVPGTVRSSIDSTQYPGTNLQGTQYLQQASSMCTKLNYTVLSPSRVEFVIRLEAEGSPCSDDYILYTRELVVVTDLCPPGFSISESDKLCVCEPRLAQYTNNCTVRNGVGKITRDSGQQFWVGYDGQSQSDDKLILSPHCPFDYCVSQAVNFSLNKESDIQCAYNRSGLLCGACKEGYSLVLGTSRCRKCPNDYHLALLIPFAVMGVALVFLLLVCKMTVATGTISGLVFYANIVQIYRTIFIPVDSTNPLLSVFIAWLNLDFGIETCFYNGMDAYSKTWLQFVFPVYIWVLVGLMILISHFSRRFARLFGNNPVSVLATLILLSYTKILRTLIAVFQSTYLDYPTHNKKVWLYDANIDYLVGKHISLFLVAVLVILLLLSYTHLLLFGQWLQPILRLRLFSWINRLKPFMDSYRAPYKAKHHYWPGLLLMVRFVLYIVFAFNIQEDPKITLLAIFLEVVHLLLWLWFSGGVYKNRYISILEGSFALNLLILTFVTYYIYLFEGNRLIVKNTWTASVSIAFATFIGILNCLSAGKCDWHHSIP